MAMAAPTVGGLRSALSSLSSTSASPCCSSSSSSPSSSSASSTGSRPRLGLGRSSFCGSSVSGGFFSAGLAGSRLSASSHQASQKQARRAAQTTAVLADVVAQETVYRIWWVIPSVVAVAVACFYPVIEVLYRKGAFVDKSRVDPRTVVSVILGGGAGTRLFPLTKRRAKPAVPIGGNYRLIDVPMSNCINSGINKVFILTQFNSASLNRHLARTYNFGNGVNFGDGFVEVLAATQRPGETGMNWFQGTADAVRQFMWLFEVLAATQTTGEGGLEWFQGTADAVRQYLWLFEDAKNKDIEHVLILSGDHLYRMDYMDFVQKHKDNGADITISCVPMDDSRASDFGLMKIDDTGRVLYFSEKPKGADLRAMQVDTTVLGLSSEEAKKKPYIASMGIYVFKKDILLKLLRWRYPAANDFGSEIIPASAKEFNVQAYLFDDYWEDIGTIKSFYEANLALTAQPPKFSFYDADKPIFTSPRYLPPTKVDKCRITESIVSHGCFLKECSVVHSIVGIRSRLETGVELKDSLMLGADFYETDVEMAALLAEGKVPVGIGENSKISNAIIDKNARIGKNVVIANTDHVLEAERPSEGFYIRSGITVILKNSTIKDGTVI